MTSSSKENPNSVGKVISAQGPVIDVWFSGHLPDIYEMIVTQTVEGDEVVLEVAEHIPGNIARCISINSTQNIQRFVQARPLGHGIRIPVGDQLFTRIINVLGSPIDGKEKIVSSRMSNIRRRAAGTRIHQAGLQGETFELVESGIKVIDLLFPLVKGSKTGILGGAALGKSILTLEIIRNIVKKHQGTCVFIGAGERIREGNELYHALSKHDILSKVMMVFGQMNEPPGARYIVAMTGVTMAEDLQEQNKDVLLFIDNVFRFLQAGSEISTLLGRVPSETGYQPTLISEASDFHERIRSSPESGGSITSFEAVYVPADDLSDPAVVAIFSFLDSIMVLSRERIQLGLYPAVDPLLSSCANLDPDIVGKLHYDTARETVQVFAKYEELRRVVLVVGIDELSSADRTVFERAKKLQNFMTQPFFVAEAYTGRGGEYVTRDQTVEGCRRIIDGKLDHIADDKFYMIGPTP